MLGLLNSFNKYSNEDLIKELINPEFNIENINKIYTKSKIDLNSLYINDEPILLSCCKKDLYNSCLWLLENKIDIELENNLKESAIFYAIYSKDTRLLDTLIDFGADLNHLNKQNRTVLQESIHNSNNKLIRFLIQKSTLFTNCDNNGNNVLFDAIINGNLNIIKKIISLKKIDINHKNSAGNTILHLDNSLKNIDLALYLLNQGTDPTIINANQQSYLFYIVTKGIKGINFIKRASELGFNLNIKNSENKNILMKAVEYFLQISKTSKRDSQAELIKELVQLNINVQAIDNQNETIFFNITRSLDRDLIHYLLNNLEKLNLNRQNIEALTVLDILVFSGIENYDLIKLYIEKGAKLDYKNKYGKSIIEILIDILLNIENEIFLEDIYKNQIVQNAQYKDILELLIKNYHINVNNFNSKNEPLFFPTLLNFNISIFKILRTKNINLNETDINGNNIIFRLLEQDLTKKSEDRRMLLVTIKNLINAGVDINSKNDKGFTALEFAILNDKEDIVKLLLNLRADCTFVDEKGRNIIHTTIFKDKENYIKLISSYNGDILNKADYFGVKPINYAAFMGKKHTVLELINLGTSINNPYKKSPNILTFLERYHKNILNLSLDVQDKNDKSNLDRLAENMILEFNIGISKK
ncbi:ankyrin repeat domain-containing protein [Aliarcobacter vitoriensis]|uniref:ankyrin repeat domain-containing protein n=1 Tax=Aliarcobacter vitoriensis TaxID=2011099 RepID=UPI003AB02650